MSRGVECFYYCLGKSRSRSVFYSHCCFRYGSYLGLGIFTPYRGTVRLMFGDGKVSETDAVYHWATGRMSKLRAVRMWSK